MAQRTSEEIRVEHKELLDKKMTAIADATRNARNKYDPDLKRLMHEFVAARSAEREAATAGGTGPNEYSK